MPDNSIKPAPYPYPIPRVDIDPDLEAAKKLNPWAVQEFFRIEALLRSTTVMDLYRVEGRTITSDVMLMLKFRFNWTVLDGSHHRYLDPRSEYKMPVPGIWLLTVEELMWLAGALSALAKKETSTLNQKFFQWAQEEVLWLCMDPALPPEVALKALRPVLTQRHTKRAKNALKEPGGVDLSTWLDYLTCYDLRFRDGHSYDEIGQIVYGSQSGHENRDRAKKAVMSVRGLIEAVQRNDWLPLSTL